MKITPATASTPNSLGLIAGLGLVGWFMRHEDLPFLTFSLAWATLVISLLPLLSWVRKGERAIPMFPLISLSYGVYAGFGAITQPNVIRLSNQYYELEWHYINKALLLSAMGLLVMNGAFRLLQLAFPRAPMQVDIRFPAKRRLSVLVAIAVLGLSGKALAALGWLPIGGHVQFSQALLLMSSTLAALFYYRLGDRRGVTKWALGVLLVYISTAGLTTGMLEAALLPIVAVVIVRTASRRELSVTGLTIFVVSVLVINVAKFEYRDRVWVGDEGRNYVQKLSIWAEITSRLNFGSVFGTSKVEGEQTMTLRESVGRFSIINRLAWVCHNTPERVPYFKGDSYKPFIYAPVPRLLWPNKPILSEVLTQIDVSYGFVESVVTAAFGIGYIGEGYANFGVMGVIMVMAFQGVGLFFMNLLLNGPRSEGGAAVFVVLLVAMFNGVGSSLIIIYGNLFQMLIAAVIVMVPFSNGLISRPVRGRPLLAPPLRRQPVAGA